MKDSKITKKEYKELDEIWKRNIKQRDNYTCQICKADVKNKPHNCHAHHILPKLKIFQKYRWNLNNGITLCYRCHKVGPYSPHMNAVWFTFWLKTNKNNQFRHIIEFLKKEGRKEK